MSFFRKLDRGSLIAIGLYLLITLLFFARFLTGDLVMAFKDLSRYFYPLRQLMVAEVMSGHLPLWNPYIFCGFPLLATLQIGFFYPLTVIYYLLPFPLAFNYYIILHYFLAACFMYAMLRHFKLDLVPAFFGGLIFAFSGYLLSVSNMNTSLSSVIWLPLVLIFVDRIAKRTGNLRLNVAVTSLLLALMFLGGEPTILYTSGWFLFFYILIFAEDKLKGLGALLLSALLAGGLVAVQLVPFIELQRSVSDRLIRTSFDLVSFRSFPPREILTFIFPYFFGNAATFGGYTETLLGKTLQDWLISPYLGVLPLAFALCAKRGKLVWFLWGTALASLVLAFGRYTPVYQLLYWFLPGVSLIRYPVKYLFLLTFCLACLSALGLGRLAGFFDGRKEALLRSFRFVWPAALAALLVSLAGHFLLGTIIAFFSRQYSSAIPAIFFRILEELIRFNLHSFYNLTAYLAIFACLLWAAARGRVSKQVFSVVLVLIAAADLLANGYTIAVAAPAEIFAAVPPNYSILLRDRGLYRFFYSPEAAAGNRVVLGDNYQEALFNAKDNFTANWPLLNGLSDFSGYESIEPYQLSQFYQDELKESGLSKKLGLLSGWNVKYVITAGPLSAPGLKLLRHKYQFGQNLYIYGNRNVKPRAYLVSGAGRAGFTAYRPGLIELKTEAKVPAQLFLCEARYPGWRALVDGQETRILPAERFFQAVEVPAGAHEVRFVYDPWSLKLGAGISLLALAGLLALIFRARPATGQDNATSP